jgi:hypothetical protein
MRLLAVLLAALLAAGGAFAQPKKGNDPKSKGQNMSREERQRMRDDMRDVYRERNFERARPADKPRQLTPEEREKLRRDIQDANRDLRR